jgi:hypothetical protein
MDPTGGWAKATETAAGATKEGIQASRDLAHFIRGPAAEVVGMLEDYLKVVRFKRRIRLMDRVRNILAEKGMAGPTRKIPLNIGAPLLEIATLEEDDNLQEVWARLLVNGGDARSGTELRRAFVSVLAEMTSLDVQNLAQIDIATRLNEGTASPGAWTYELPERAIQFDQTDGNRYNRDPSPEVATSLSNLSRLGCVMPFGQVGTDAKYRLLMLSPFGRAFIEACTK